MLRSLSSSVLPCNDGLDTRKAPCPLYEEKDQDGKCRFGPVRSTATVDNFTTLSSEFDYGYATCIEFNFSSEDRRRYNTSSSASASNFIHGLRKNTNIITMLTHDVLYTTSFLQNVVNSKYM